jgi:hypothetical protein
MLESLHIPGASWMALIAFVMKWLPELFPGQQWLPCVFLGLLARSKALEALVTAPGREMFDQQRLARRSSYVHIVQRASCNWRVHLPRKPPAPRRQTSRAHARHPSTGPIPSA